MKQGQEYTLSSDWVWDDDELEAAFTSKTKAIVLNTPSNPLGKVFNEQELNKIADLCKKHNVICIFDEVYQKNIYNGKHINIGKVALI